MNQVQVRIIAVSPSQQRAEIQRLALLAKMEAEQSMKDFTPLAGHRTTP